MGFQMTGSSGAVILLRPEEPFAEAFPADDLMLYAAKDG